MRARVAAAAVGVVAVTWVILYRTMLGRSIFAIGGSEESARRIGIPVRAVQLFVYVYVGVLAGLAGIIHASMARVANPFDLVGLELSVIAAVVLGAFAAVATAVLIATRKPDAGSSSANDLSRRARLPAPADWASVRPVLPHAFGLSTAGVALTALVVGIAAHLLLGFSPLEGLLLGAIISSTDAAAVFAVLRSKGVHLRGRLKPLLELESGSNDPMAVFLTVAFLQLLTRPSASTTRRTVQPSRTSTPRRPALRSRISSNLDRSTWNAVEAGSGSRGDIANENCHGSGLRPQRKVPPRLSVKPARSTSSATPRTRHRPCTVEGSSDSPIW